MNSTISFAFDSLKRADAASSTVKAGSGALSALGGVVAARKPPGSGDASPDNSFSVALKSESVGQSRQKIRPKHTGAKAAVAAICKVLPVSFSR